MQGGGEEARHEEGGIPGCSVAPLRSPNTDKSFRIEAVLMTALASISGWSSQQ